MDEYNYCLELKSRIVVQNAYLDICIYQFLLSKKIELVIKFPENFIHTR